MRKLLAAYLLVCLGVSAQSATYPTAVAADADLKIAKNNLSTRLLSAAAAGDTSLAVVSTTGFVANMLVQVDSEIVSICGVSGANLLTVGVTGACPSVSGRGFDNTTAAGHATNRTVSVFHSAWHHNKLAAEVKALQGEFPGGAQRYNVKSARFGAIGDGVANDTAAIQSAINVARSAGGGVVYFPAGVYSVTQLDMTGLHSVYLQGAGLNAAHIVPRNGTAAYGTTSGHLIDGTGSRAWGMRDITIGNYAQTACPTTGVLLAGDAAVGSQDSVYFRHVYISGCYTVATMYVYWIASSTFDNLILYNYRAGANATLMMVGDDLEGLTSAFRPIATGLNRVPGDISCVQCEIHHMGDASGIPMVIRGGPTDLNWYAGNLSSNNSQAAYVDFRSPATYIRFHNVSFYSDFSSPPTNVFAVQPGATVFGFDPRGSIYEFVSGFVGGAGNVLGSTTALLAPSVHTTMGSAVAAGSTVYLGVAGHDTTEGNAATPLTTRALVSEPQFYSSASPGVGQTYTATLMANGVATGVTCQVTGAATSCTDTTHYASLGKGDRFSWRVVTSASANASHFSASMPLIPW